MKKPRTVKKPVPPNRENFIHRNSVTLWSGSRYASNAMFSLQNLADQNITDIQVILEESGWDDDVYVTLLGYTNEEYFNSDLYNAAYATYERAERRYTAYTEELKLWLQSPEYTAEKEREQAKAAMARLKQIEKLRKELAKLQA